MSVVLADQPCTRPPGEHVVIARGRPFLTAEWRHLAMINFAIEPQIVEQFVPAGTEIDYHQGRTYASIVGFRFLNTRVRGFRIPCHVNFDEVNLRLYVRRRGPRGWRRGVVFVRELVARRAVAWVARAVYNENYGCVPMSHEIALRTYAAGPPESLRFSWVAQGRDSWLAISPAAIARSPAPGSLDEFIVEHYWGYSRQRDGGTKEYEVVHPPWRVAPAEAFEFHAHVAELYGPQFVKPLSRPPVSAFWADGSAVRVYSGVRI